MTSDYKHYTEKASRGIKGEAFFEGLMVDFAIPHRISRQNDLGVDFLCELCYGDRPSGILFVAQVKSSTSDKITCKPDMRENDQISKGISRFNQLDTYTLKGAKKVDEATLNYWKGLGLPSYLFYVVEQRSEERNELECYYKRYTPLLDGRTNSDDLSPSMTFYHVNRGSQFRAFANMKNETKGFARDLIVDYARISYYKGQIVQMTAEKLGFWPFARKPQPEEVKFFRK